MFKKRSRKPDHSRLLADIAATTVHVIVISASVVAVSQRDFFLRQEDPVVLFQVYVMMIIFAISAPEVLLSSIGRSEVRLLIRRTFRFERSFYWLLGFLSVGAFTTACYRGLGILSLSRQCWDRILIVAIVSSVSATLLSVLYYVRNFRFSAILRRVARGARHRILTSASDDFVPIGHFRSLRDLGSGALDQEEGLSVESTFQGLMLDIVRSRNYSGNHLDEAFQCFTVMTENSWEIDGQRLGSRLCILEKIRAEIDDRRPGSTDSRLVRAHIRRMSNRVVEISIARSQTISLPAIHQAISSLEGDIPSLFSLCCRLLQSGRHPLRLTVVQRFIANYRETQKPEDLARLLGLAALLRRSGAPERKWVQSNIVDAFGLNLRLSLKMSFGKMFRFGEFSAADAIFTWKSEVFDRCKSAMCGVSFHFSLIGGNTTWREVEI